MSKTTLTFNSKKVYLYLRHKKVRNAREFGGIQSVLLAPEGWLM